MHIIANNASVPYFNWIAERGGRYPGVKFSFVALYPEMPVMSEEMKGYGCDFYWIKFDQSRRKRGMVRSFFNLYALFRKIKPDVVHTHLFDDSLPAILAARVAGVRMRVIQKEDTGFHWNFKPLWVWADRFNNVNATHIVAISKESKRFILDKEKAPSSKVFMIHNGIDLKAIRLMDEESKNRLRKEFNPENKFLICTISRYIEWKGYRYIIDAVKNIVTINNNVKFLFVGYGGQEHELKELIEQYGLNDFIQLSGWIDRKVMPSLYGIMDLYLHAAYMEPFGFVLAEAMANGVPIVTTRTGVAADVLVHKESCYFVNTKDSASIAEGITWIINHPEERRMINSKTKRIADDSLGADRMLDEYVGLYKRHHPAFNAPSV